MSNEVFDELVASSPVSKTDEQIQALESKVQALETKLNEDRFIALGAFIILFDAYIFEHMSNWGSPIALLVIEFVVLLVIARKLKIEDVTMFSDKIISAIGRNKTDLS